MLLLHNVFIEVTPNIQRKYKTLQHKFNNILLK
jgi:hypothetical protein